MVYRVISRTDRAIQRNSVLKKKKKEREREREQENKKRKKLLAYPAPGGWLQLLPP